MTATILALNYVTATCLRCKIVELPPPQGDIKSYGKFTHANLAWKTICFYERSINFGETKRKSRMDSLVGFRCSHTCAYHSLFTPWMYITYPFAEAWRV